MAAEENKHVLEIPEIFQVKFINGPCHRFFGSTGNIVPTLKKDSGLVLCWLLEKRHLAKVGRFTSLLP